MSPLPEARDALFKVFARGLFRRDMDLLYTAATEDFLWSWHDGLLATKALRGGAAILAHLDEQKSLFSEQAFHEVAYHHLPDTSFMTFRVSETLRATGARREQQGIERYTFRDGKIAAKDVYRKPVA